MFRHNVQIISAPSILGLRPSGVERLPKSLLDAGLKEQLASPYDVIDVPDLNHLYSDKRSSSHAVLNEESLKTFSIELSERIENVLSTNKFPLVLGGDCSVLIGAMLALKSRGRFGLIFMDAHADFYLPHQSKTGEAADMDLAIVTGRGSSMLTDINKLRPYVTDANVFHVGQRDMDEAELFGCQSLEDTGIHVYNYPMIRAAGLKKCSDSILKLASEHELDGYWIHFDADVLADDVNPAVDYRLPEGLAFEECEYLLQRFIQSLPIAGMTVTIYNPALDPDRMVAPHLVACLVRAFA
jgi:arginase